MTLYKTNGNVGVSLVCLLLSFHDLVIFKLSSIVVFKLHQFLERNNCYLARRTRLLQIWWPSHSQMGALVALFIFLVDPLAKLMAKLILRNILWPHKLHNNFTYIFNKIKSGIADCFLLQ